MNYLLTSELPPRLGSHAIRVKEIFLQNGIEVLDLKDFVHARLMHHKLQGLAPSLYNIAFPEYVKFNVDEKACAQFAEKLNHDDIVVSSSGSYVSHIVGYTLKKINPNIIWIADLGDPWGSPELFPDALFHRKLLANYHQRKYFDLVDKICVTTIELKNKLVSDGYVNTHYLPMGYRQIHSEEKKRGTMIYSGSAYYRSRNLIPLIDAVTEMGMTLTILGDVSEKFKDYVATNKLQDSVCFHKRVTHERALELEAQNEINVVVLNKSNIQVPGKLYQCISSNKTIIVTQAELNQEVLDIVSQNKHVKIVDNNKKSIKQAIGELRLLETRLELSEEFVVNFEWSALKRRFGKILENE